MSQLSAVVVCLGSRIDRGMSSIECLWAVGGVTDHTQKKIVMPLLQSDVRRSGAGTGMTRMCHVTHDLSAQAGSESCAVVHICLTRPECVQRQFNELAASTAAVPGRGGRSGTRSMRSYLSGRFVPGGGPPPAGSAG